MYFQVHQPYRLKWFWPTGSESNANSETKKGEKIAKTKKTKGNNKGTDLYNTYFDEPLNKYTFNKVAKKCYWPANNTMLKLIDEFKNNNKKFKISYSLSGVFVEQCELWDPDLLETFRRLQETGCVEFLGETYYHSLASLFEDSTEFIEQIGMHRELMKDVFGIKTKVFRNTELLYHDVIAKTVSEQGFDAILTEGIERVLDDWKSPNYVYNTKKTDIAVLLRNYKISDDVGYRFSAKWWSEWPLTAEKYATWLASTPGDTINIFMDYETFGEHQWEDTGIFKFLRSMPGEILKWDNLDFATPSEVIKRYDSVGSLTVPWYETVSWADMERDPSAWLGNHMQQVSFAELKGMEGLVKESQNPEFMRIWRYLMTGDHFYYMCAKGWGDGDVHCYFSHHGTPYDAGINYMAVLSNFKEMILREELKKVRDEVKEKKA